MKRADTRDIGEAAFVIPARRTARTSWGRRLTTIAMLSLAVVVGAAQADAAPKKTDHNSVSGLVNQIAQVNQNLADLDQNVAVRQENVNRALVDYQNAIAAQRLATIASRGAKKSLTSADGAVADAQRKFNTLARSIYRKGGNPSSLSSYVSGDDPQKVMDRATVGDRLTQQQQATIQKLRIARNQKANRVAAVEAARRQAVSATRGAATRKSDALTAISQARQAVSAEQARRKQLVANRDVAQRRLNILKGVRSTKVDAPVIAKLPPGIPVAGGNDAAQLAIEAAAKLALDVGQKLVAALVGQQQLPHSKLLDELGIGGSDLTSTGPNGSLSKLGSGSLGSLFGSSGGGGQVQPGLRGPQAVEVVVNRALSQLNLPYAWGGGDANGPTKGIRDGGVADSYGDYNKIGFDCSGLMIYAFAGIGYDLPHYTGYQYTSGPQVPLAQIQRGDMIFYGPSASQHVALYLGDNKMVEAPESGSVVKISPLRTDGAMPNVVRLW
ncbi:putative Rpf-interacting protein [Gordonia effusa NBRC 100432]|uniref:Putative Rpf-interacting protein n=1 Tax=Gordonia effusa NBRC 100432 TaxID=1077974 RepID=H0R4J0_9ACTN|nr:putative Rpf-interacting protein [Gordonia effusa NBRC 100432]